MNHNRNNPNRRERTLPRPRAALVLVSLAALTAAGCGSDEPAASNTAVTSPTVATNSSSQDSGPSNGMIGDGYPISVSSCGRESTFETAPTRVVVGWPTTIDTLVALGVADSVIGYTSGSFDAAPDDAPNAVELSPDYQASREVVIAAEPDLFLTNDENQLAAADGGLGYDDLAELDAGAYVLGGYCIDAIAPTGIDIVYQDISQLGMIFGVPDTATTLIADLKTRAQTAHDTVTADSDDAPTIAFVQVYDGKLYALTGTYYAMAVEAAGYDSVFADGVANFAEISAEEVLTLAPDVVAVAYNSEETRADDTAAAVDLLANTPAVADDRVVEISNAAVSAGGVSLFDVIDRLAADGS